MAEALILNQTMKSVVLSGTCRGLCGYATWRWIDMERACTGNRIGNVGARAMAEMLKLTRSVKTMLLSGKCRSRV